MASSSRRHRVGPVGRIGSGWLFASILALLLLALEVFGGFDDFKLVAGWLWYKSPFIRLSIEVALVVFITFLLTGKIHRELANLRSSYIELLDEAKLGEMAISFGDQSHRTLHGRYVAAKECWDDAIARSERGERVSPRVMVAASQALLEVGQKQGWHGRGLEQWVKEVNKQIAAFEARLTDQTTTPRTSLPDRSRTET